MSGDILSIKETQTSDIKHYISPPPLRWSDADEALRAHLAELGIDFNSYMRSVNRTQREAHEPAPDLRFAVQDGLDSVSKARNPELPLGQVLASVADFFAPGTTNRFDSTALLEHLRSEFRRKGDGTGSQVSAPQALNEQDLNVYEKVAGDLVEGLRAFADPYTDGRAFGESVRAALSEANQAGLDSKKLISSLVDVLKKPA